MGEIDSYKKRQSYYICKYVYFSFIYRSNGQMAKN